MPANRQGNGNFFNYSALTDSRSQRTSAARNSTLATTSPATINSAPATAIDAPSKGSNNVFTGLCEALNKHQQDLVKKYPGYVADEYVIDFAATSMAAAKVTKPTITYKNTAGKSTKTAQDKLDRDTDSVSTNSQTWQVLAGTQIIQLIDQVMRSSTYITDQQKVNIDDNGKQTKNTKANTNGVTAWYKINITSTQLKYDTVRRDFAYRMTYTISPYAINQMISPYFPNSKYRGPHKSYNYWFTGLNTQILSYEQEYNQAYYTTMTSNASGLVIPPPTGRDQMKQTYMAASEQRGQGQANYVNEPADSAASFLYSKGDFSEVRMKIVGDPGWMQQGEASFGVIARAFNFGPFNTDGGINYDSQEVTFNVSFNRPTDYNFNTGVMNTNNAAGAPQEKFTYIAKFCKNVFSKGQFTQEIVGSLLPSTTTSNTTAGNGRATAPTAATQSRLPTNIKTTNPGLENTSPPSSLTGDIAGVQRFDDGSYIQTFDDGSVLTSDTEGNISSTPAPQYSSPPGPPTSSGDIDYNAGLAGTDTGPTSGGPQLIARNDE
jgi:hypothetical protein